jgi:hypothetical protein
MVEMKCSVSAPPVESKMSRPIIVAVTEVAGFNCVTGTVCIFVTPVNSGTPGRAEYVSVPVNVALNPVELSSYLSEWGEKNGFDVRREEIERDWDLIELMIHKQLPADFDRTRFWDRVTEIQGRRNCENEARRPPHGRR